MEKAIRHRRSIRSFEARQVSDEMVETILEAGRWAPSGLNNQPWRFAVIRDARLREELSGLTTYSAIIKSAALVIAVFYDTEAGYNRTKDIQAIGACIENMLLQICDLGLGGVWLGEILRSSDEVKKLTGAPDAYEFMAAIALGYPARAASTDPGRKPLSELVFFRG